MRSLYLTFQEKDFNKLKTAKNKAHLPWENFILKRCTAKKKESAKDVKQR